jgi:hypothetical protein
MTALRSSRSAGRSARPAGWSTARLLTAVTGALLALCSLGLLAAGGTAAWADRTQGHGGDIDLGTWIYRSTGYAVAGRPADMFGEAGGWDVLRSLLGTVRIRVASSASSSPVFLGIAPARAASGYLAGVSYDTVRGISRDHATYAAHRGAAPATAPGQAGIWAAETTGLGRQTLSWPARDGSWMAVAMNADGSRPVSVRIQAAAALPSLPWLTAGLLTGGGLLLAAGIILIVVPARHARRPRRDSARHDQ